MRAQDLTVGVGGCGCLSLLLSYVLRHSRLPAHSPAPARARALSLSLSPVCEGVEFASECVSVCVCVWLMGRWRENEHVYVWVWVCVCVCVCVCVREHVCVRVCARWRARVMRHARR